MTVVYSEKPLKAKVKDNTEPISRVLSVMKLNSRTSRFVRGENKVPGFMAFLLMSCVLLTITTARTINRGLQRHVRNAEN